MRRASFNCFLGLHKLEPEVIENEDYTRTSERRHSTYGGSQPIKLDCLPLERKLSKSSLTDQSSNNEVKDSSRTYTPRTLLQGSALQKVNGLDFKRTPIRRKSACSENASYIPKIVVISVTDGDDSNTYDEESITSTEGHPESVCKLSPSLRRRSYVSSSETVQSEKSACITREDDEEDSQLKSSKSIERLHLLFASRRESEIQTAVEQQKNEVNENDNKADTPEKEELTVTNQSKHKNRRLSIFGNLNVPKKTTKRSRAKSASELTDNKKEDVKVIEKQEKKEDIQDSSLLNARSLARRHSAFVTFKSHLNNRTESVKSKPDGQNDQHTDYLNLFELLSGDITSNVSDYFVGDVKYDHLQDENENNSHVKKEGTLLDNPETWTAIKKRSSIASIPIIEEYQEISESESELPSKISTRQTNGSSVPRISISPLSIQSRNNSDSSHHSVSSNSFVPISPEEVEDNHHESAFDILKNPSHLSRLRSIFQKQTSVDTASIASDNSSRCASPQNTDSFNYKLDENTAFTKKNPFKTAIKESNSVRNSPVPQILITDCSVNNDDSMNNSNVNSRLSSLKSTTSEDDDGENTAQQGMTAFELLRNPKYLQRLQTLYDNRDGDSANDDGDDESEAGSHVKSLSSLNVSAKSMASSNSDDSDRKVPLTQLSPKLSSPRPRFNDNQTDQSDSDEESNNSAFDILKNSSNLQHLQTLYKARQDSPSASETEESPMIKSESKFNINSAFLSVTPRRAARLNLPDLLSSDSDDEAVTSTSPLSLNTSFRSSQLETISDEDEEQSDTENESAFGLLGNASNLERLQAIYDSRDKSESPSDKGKFSNRRHSVVGVLKSVFSGKAKDNDKSDTENSPFNSPEISRSTKILEDIPDEKEEEEDQNSENDASFGLLQNPANLSHLQAIFDNRNIKKPKARTLKSFQKDNLDKRRHSAIATIRSAFSNKQSETDALKDMKKSTRVSRKKMKNDNPELNYMKNRERRGSAFVAMFSAKNMQRRASTFIGRTTVQDEEEELGRLSILSKTFYFVSLKFGSIVIKILKGIYMS